MLKIQKLLLIFSIFSLLIAGFLHPITALTQDLGRHLLMGDIILKTYSVPQTNLFSYTYPDFPFINTHWLSEVAFFIVQNLFGFNGLLLVMTALIVFTFGLVFFSTIKKNSIYAATIISILYIRVLFERTDIRPEIFSFLFLSIFIVILYKYREKYTRWIFLLPFIELLWVNIHIYFPIGIAVLGLFFIDLIIKHRKNLYSKYIGIFALIILTSTFVTLLNPNGLNGALYPFNVFQNYGYQIEENQTVFFLWNYFGGKTTILYFFISAAMLFLSLFLTIKKVRPIDWFLAIFFTYLAANAERNLPLFVFGTFIPFTYSLSIIIRKIKLRQKTRIIQNTISLILILIILWNIKDVVQLKGFGIGVAKGAERGADFFLENNLKGPIFNNFDIGSYLDYRLYPKEQVFIDGRPEAYPASFIQQVYIPMQTDQNLFNEQDKKYHFNTIFFSHTDMTPWARNFLKWVAEDKQWKLVYLDDYIVILVKNTKNNQLLKQKIVIDQNPLALLGLANFFQLAGWAEYEEKTYQQLLTIESNNCTALYNLAVILTQRNDPTSALYSQRFQQSCK